MKIKQHGNVKMQRYNEKSFKYAKLWLCYNKCSVMFLHKKNFHFVIFLNNINISVNNYLN